MPTSAAPIISVDGVTKRYGGVAAVDDLHLDIAEGEFLSLLGPSGCGKTTLLRMIGGFEEPDEGDITIKGASVIGVPPNKRTVNTVFQAYALFPHMTVAENVAYGLRQRKVPRSEIGTRVGDALRLVQMGEFADRPPKKLSGGQQQRVALARAIVNRPDVLLLDEPMSALDRQLREQMQVELKLIQRKVGITFVFVTHDQEEALSMSDRVVVMRDGHIEQIGTSQQVYETPASSFVASFIGKQNFAAATVRAGGRLEAADAVFVPGSDLNGFAAGSAVQATVRAESIRISGTDPQRDHNVARGTLAGSSFLGDVIQHIVITDSGRELLARVPVQGSEPLTTGAPVWCSWEPAAVHVFAAEVASA